MKELAPRIYLSAPHMGGDELTYVHSAFEKNWIAPLGANVDGFEQDIQQYTGCGHAAVVTSGTAAIHLALRLCDVGPGDEVICQTFTFAASANPILYQGATPVFVDSEPDTWNMDPEMLEKAIRDRMELDNDPRSNTTSKGKNSGRKPKAIVLVHLYGMPAKIEQIREIARRYDIPLIEDAAEALGSAVEEEKCGSFGDFAILSFNGNKIITTSGGGALLGRDQAQIAKARFLATQARDDAPHYQHSQLGYNYRMSNILAGIGRGQMQVLDHRVAARRENHAYYFKQLNGTWLTATGDSMGFRKSPYSSKPAQTGIYFLKEPAGYFSNRWLTTILVNPSENGGVVREDIYRALEQENIESRPLWKPMHLQPLYKDYPYYGTGLSERLFKYGLCLPSGSNMSSQDRERVVSVITRLLADRTSKPAEQNWSEAS